MSLGRCVSLQFSGLPGGQTLDNSVYQVVPESNAKVDLMRLRGRLIQFQYQIQTLQIEGHVNINCTAVGKKRAHRASSKATRLFLRSNKSNINQRS